MKKIIKNLIIISIMVAIFAFSPLNFVRAFASDNTYEAFKFAEKYIREYNVFYNFDTENSGSNSTDIILYHMKPMKEIDKSDGDVLGVFSYNMYKKTSKKLFGKIIPFKSNSKRIYFKNNHIYQYRNDLGMDDGDFWTVKRSINKIDNNTYKVAYYSVYSNWYHSKDDSISPNSKTVAILKKNNGKFYISKISSTKSNYVGGLDKNKDKAIKEIKKWYYHGSSLDKKITERGEYGTNQYLLHNYNIVFIYNKNGNKERRYYFSNGVLIKTIISENGKVIKTENSPSLYSYNYEDGENDINIAYELCRDFRP